MRLHPARGSAPVIRSGRWIEVLRAPLAHGRKHASRAPCGHALGTAAQARLRHRHRDLRGLRRTGQDRRGDRRARGDPAHPGTLQQARCAAAGLSPTAAPGRRPGPGWRWRDSAYGWTEPVRCATPQGCTRPDAALSLPKDSKSPSRPVGSGRVQRWTLSAPRTERPQRVFRGYAARRLVQGWRLNFLYSL